MSNASPLNTDSATSEGSSASSVRQIDPQFTVRFVGFWTAVIVPFVFLGLTVLGTTGQSPLLLTGLLVANVAGLVLGKDYKR